MRVSTPEAMRALGASLGAVARAGDLIVLAGPLGAGKTVLAQGIALGLGVPDRVTSPTFVIAHVHRGGRVPFVHVDAYRLSSFAEVDDLDLDASLDSSVTAVEWGLGLVEPLAGSWLLVSIARSAETEVREVTLTPYGGDWASRLPAPRDDVL